MRLFFFLFLACAMLHSSMSNVQLAVSNLCFDATALLPVTTMLMIVIAGIIYATGQIMGAETRARANVWATAALMGPLIAMAIYAIAPPFFGMLMGGGAVSCTVQ